MPELPEVETIARGLARRVNGDTIDSVWIGSHKEPLKSPAQEIAAALEHARILDVKRVGKHIAVDLGPPDGSGQVEARQWIIHLGMTGRVLVCNPEEALPKHTHLIAKLRSGRELRFVDPRRLGRLSVTRERFAGPGREPLEIPFEDFYRIFKTRKLPIKSALLNQGLLHGVGNIYADEALFRAGIRSRRRTNAITRAEYLKLHEGLRQVLREAIELGGSSVSDYVDAEGEAGFFQLQHRVYMRTGEPCLVCKMPIKRIVLGGRGTHYCPKCQR